MSRIHIFFYNYGKRLAVWYLLFIVLLASCTSQNKSHQAFQQSTSIDKKIFATDTRINGLLNDSSLAHALVGVSVYDVEAKKYIHRYNDDKYFVPASNTKLFTCYAAMKYLGDSLVGLRYSNNNGQIIITGNGDPTFLQSEFLHQPVYDFLKNNTNVGYLEDDFLTRFLPLGNGWAWNDYQEAYMPERSEFPIYGNCAKFYIQDDTLAVIPNSFYNFKLDNQLLRTGVGKKFQIVRPFETNVFHELVDNSVFSHQYIPFKTISDPTFPYLNPTFIKLLEDTLGKKLDHYSWTDNHSTLPNVIHSQPTDSLLKITMHRSDNFFAEQTLLMVSNEKLGYMSDEKIIDTLLKTDLKDVPQQPNWVDGSGLSRYDLFTPQDFVYILEKMKDEFGLDRLKNILPTGNTGTLEGLYKNLNGKIFAKTGTLGNQVALSGFIITQKGKLLIFSVLVNNHMTSAGKVRRAVEKFINQVWISD